MHLHDRASGLRLAGWQRVLSVGFGVLWVIDGLLKLQPGMFSSSLVVNVVGPNALNNQPPWLYHIMFQGIKVWHAGLPWTTLIMALFEMALGIGIMAARGPWRRVALWGSVAWCAIVWVMAEGMGGVLTGSANFPGGAPGSTPIYALGAMVLLFPTWVTSRWYRWVAGFWGLAALVQCLPYNWSAANVGAVFGDVTMNGTEPVLIDRLNSAFIVLAYHMPILLNGLMVAVMALLAIGWVVSRGNGVIWWLTLLWLGFLWAIPQALATLFTGTATDLGLEFPLALLLWVAKDLARPEGLATTPSDNVAKGTLAH